MKGQYNRTEPLEIQRNLRGCLSKEICLVFKVLRFITSTSLLLAANGAMVVVFGFLMYGSVVMPPLLLAAFLVTFSVYGLNKVTDKAEDSINKPETVPNASDHYLVLSVASMFTGLLIGALMGITAFIVLFTPIIIGTIYSVSISNSIPRLKEVVGLKSLVVAVSWALTGSLLPDSIFAENTQACIIVFAYIFIRILVGTILCDVLDEKGDFASGVETIPIRLGKSKTKKLLILINSLGMLLSVYCITTGMFTRLVPALLFGVFYGYTIIWFVFSNNCKRSIAGLMLDGEWFPIIMVAGLLIR